MSETAARQPRDRRPESGGEKAAPGRGFWAEAWLRFRRRKLAMTALVFVGLLAVVIVVRRFCAGRRLGPRALRVWSTAWIIIGVLGLLVGVLPLAGLLLLVVGIVLKVRPQPAPQHISR